MASLVQIPVQDRFNAHGEEEQSENDAARIAALLLFVLAACVAVASAMPLLGYSEPKTTELGYRF